MEELVEWTAGDDEWNEGADAEERIPLVDADEWNPEGAPPERMVCAKLRVVGR
jgi:hypothetical protein